MFDMNTLNYKKNNNIYNTNNYIKKVKNIITQIIIFLY
jgi:hypothetical protein